MIKSMREQEMSISEIARRTGVSRKTVRKYIGMDKPGDTAERGDSLSFLLIQNM